MNLLNSYRITLQNKKRVSFIQYIEANNMDEAIKKARNSFLANLEGLKEGVSEAQKACPLTILEGKLRFGFVAGWINLNVSGLNIFEALEKAQNHSFVENKKIKEITSI